MTLSKNPGRWVGLLYVAVSIVGFFGLAYVPEKLMVHGNAAATAGNIAAHQTLFQLGIACNLISETLFIWVALALYGLFKGVDRRQAALMVGLIVVSVPIAMLNELNAIAALILVRGADFLAVFDKPQREALAMLFLKLQGQGFGIAEIFWGLWLFPMGLLTYRSRFIPRILGVLLVLAGFSWLSDSLAPFLLPQYESVMNTWMSPLRNGELLFMFWLLIVGAKPKRAAEPAISE
jgi:hypothetical protein